MPDEFWFEVSTTVDVIGSDGHTVIGHLQADTPYRAIDANEHWLAIPGPNGSRGFIAIAELDYREVDPPASVVTPAADGPGHTAGTSEPTDEADEAVSADDEANKDAADSEALVTAARIDDATTATPHSGDVAPPLGDRDQVTGPDGADESEDATEAGAHDTTAYVHAASDDRADDPEDPSARKRRQQMIAAGAVFAVIIVLFIISSFGGDSTPPTTLAAATTTSTIATSTTTTTPPPAVSTTVPAVGTTPAATTAPRNWRIVFYNDFTNSRDDAFPVGEITANAAASIVDGAYLVDIDGQRSMETLLQIPLTSRFAYFGATVGETRLEAGAHVCGLLFSTDEKLYVVTINAEVATGPREFAIVDGSGGEVLPVTGSTVVQPGENHVAVLVRTPQYRLFINGEEVAKGKIDGKQFTGFGLTYGASSSGQCSFDDLEVWRPPLQTDTTTDEAVDTPPED